MKDTKNIINKYSFDRYELERNFDIEMEDETFKKLVSKLKLSKDELIKYTSRIKDASLELKNCANCKILWYVRIIYVDMFIILVYFKII